MTTVSPSIDTLAPNPPKKSSASPSLAVSLTTCVQPEERLPAVSRVKTYADPELDPLSSSPLAPMTTVSPSIDTPPKLSFAAASSAVSLATCVQPELRSSAVSRVKTYAAPLLYADPLPSSYLAPITIVSPSIDKLSPR